MGAGLAYIALNALRVCSVTILTLDILAAVIMLVIEAKQEFRYFFFSIVNLILLILGSIVLLVSEMPVNLSTRLLQQSLPVLSYGHSLAWTGLPILLIACTILNSLRSSFYDISSGFISQPLRTLVFAAGVASGVLSLLYLLMPLFFWRPGKPGGECRRLRKDGALAAQESSGSDTSSLRLKPFAVHDGPVISRPVYVPEPPYQF